MFRSERYIISVRSGIHDLLLCCSFSIVSVILVLHPFRPRQSEQHVSLCVCVRVQNAYIGAAVCLIVYIVYIVLYKVAIDWEGEDYKPYSSWSCCILLSLNASIAASSRSNSAKRSSSSSDNSLPSASAADAVITLSACLSSSVATLGSSSAAIVVWARRCHTIVSISVYNDQKIIKVLLLYNLQLYGLKSVPFPSTCKKKLQSIKISWRQDGMRNR